MLFSLFSCLLTQHAEWKALDFIEVKFLAAEALRGVGGVLLDKEGKRFANELGRRDYVTGRMWQTPPLFRDPISNRSCLHSSDFCLTVRFSTFLLLLNVLFA